MDKDAKFSDSQLVFYVKNVLKLSIQGDCQSYNELVSVINHNQRLGIDEVAVLVALSGVVSCIHMVHRQSLMNYICCMRLWNNETDVMDALVKLLLLLASSSGQLDLCLYMILNGPCGLTRKSLVLDRVHSTLKYIADLVPLSPMSLEKIVIERMPHFCSNVDAVMMMYVENMLRLENGALGKLVGSTTLVAIVDLLVELDMTKIPCRYISKDDFTRGIFDMEFGEFEGIGDDAENCMSIILVV
ncbi:general transcription factor [Lithospermum erythrorhizon]|uniref:General transcription factor n=1 Tax=Lithospermum erythrorhizon TaxID=34254 RepID=A0AAV3Q6B4_LITER